MEEPESTSSIIDNISIPEKLQYNDNFESHNKSKNKNPSIVGSNKSTGIIKHTPNLGREDKPFKKNTLKKKENQRGVMLMIILRNR